MSTLSQLSKAGAIRSSAPVKQTIEWVNDDGDTFEFDVWIKPMSFGDAIDIQSASPNEAIVLTLAACVLLDDGQGNTVPMDAETARSLHPSLGWKLAMAVNGLREDRGEAKNSQPPTSFSANSSSQASAAKRSRKREKS